MSYSKLPSILLLSTLISSGIFAQQKSLPGKGVTPNSNYYFHKAQSQKTIAWVLLGGGAVLSAISFKAAVANAWIDLFENGDNDSGTGYTILFWTGVGSMSASIPLFLASEKSRRQGQLLLTSQSNLFLKSIRKDNLVSLTFRYHF